MKPKLTLVVAASLYFVVACVAHAQDLPPDEIKKR